MTKNDHNKQPQLGTYVTMIIGLLLLFLLVSQAGKYHESGFIVEKAKERVALHEERRKALLKIGATDATIAKNLLTDERITLAAGINTPSTHHNSITLSSSTVMDIQNTGINNIIAGDQTQKNKNLHKITLPDRSSSQKHYYRVRKDETLYRISTRIYGNGNLWRSILKANPQVNDPGNLKPGMKLFIPSPDTPNSSFRRWLAQNDTENTSGMKN